MPTDDELNAGAIIIELPTMRDRPLLSHEKSRISRSVCLAHAFVLDDDERTVRCRKCNAKFEAFDALIDLAQMWDRYLQQIIGYEHESERLRKEQEVLERDVRNLKAQRRRHIEALASTDAPRCPAINHYKRQCALPVGHDEGDNATDHHDRDDPHANFGWRKPASR